MREIKFKVWDKKEKCWIADGLDMDLYYSAKVGCFMFDNDDYDLARREIEFVQFTGLNDKNGKEIYEGDIVSASEERGVWKLYLVEWLDNHCAFSLTNNGYWCGKIIGRFDIEVIGNICENKELLNGK